MNFNPVTYNGNTVVLYGRMFFVVTSNSRKGLIHFVDLEESPDWRWKAICTCEAWRYGERPCRHIKACIIFLLDPLKLSEEALEYAASEACFYLQLGFTIQEAFQRIVLRAGENSGDAGGAVKENPIEAPKGTFRVYHMDGSERRSRLRVRPVSATAD